MPETISENDLKRWEDALADSWPLGDDGCAGTFGRSCPPDIKPEAISYRQARALIAGYRDREKWKDLYSMVRVHCKTAEAELWAIKVERDMLKERLERVRVRASSLRANDKDGHFGDGLSAAGAQVLAILDGKDEPLAEREG